MLHTPQNVKPSTGATGPPTKNGVEDIFVKASLQFLQVPDSFGKRMLFKDGFKAGDFSSIIAEE
jgi:hypothetical protein